MPRFCLEYDTTTLQHYIPHLYSQTANNHHFPTPDAKSLGSRPLLLGVSATSDGLLLSPPTLLLLESSSLFQPSHIDPANQLSSRSHALADLVTCPVGLAKAWYATRSSTVMICYAHALPPPRLQETSTVAAFHPQRLL